MKKFAKYFLCILVLILLISGSTFAAEKEYVLRKEIIYQNNRSATLKDGFVEIMIGQTDFTQYADDEYIKVTPKPDKIKEDDFGNLYAYYDARGMLKNEKLVITIERKVKVTSFVTDEPILARSNGSVTADNKIYVQPQDRVECNEKEIIDKANELTKDLTTDYRKAAAIFEYVNTNMSYVTDSSSANKGALAALKSMKGVCEEFATLFVALCRAEQIPSRVVAGYKYDNTNGNNTIIDHVWAEIYLDDYGWLPVEPTVIYTVNKERVTYWNSFCALDTPNYIPTEIYECENGNRTFKILEENYYKLEFFSDNEIIAPKQNTFEDISNYTWAIEPIQNLYEKDIVEGYSESVYGPERNISRIEFICMLSRTLKYMNENSATNAYPYYYPSYNQNHWSKDEYDFLMKCYQFYTPTDIASAGYYNIVSVFGNELNIDKAITRGEVVALMDTFLNDATVDATFSDVKWNTKFASSIQKAFSNGLIEGYLDGTFRPENTITRAEMAAILGRYIANNMYVISE